MASNDPGLVIPAVPQPLRAVHRAEAWSLAGDDALTLRAGPRTDWFIDPESGAVTSNAPALLMPTDGPWMLKARVSADHRAMYDAAVLVVWVSDDVWAKLCLELSPQGQVTVVSVVTRGTSDDCNSVALGRPEVHLRISRLERAYAFHYSQDGVSWKLVRFFALGEKQRAEVGFLAQSPTGDGCTAEFRDIDFAPQKLGDVRSGV